MCHQLRCVWAEPVALEVLFAGSDFGPAVFVKTFWGTFEATVVGLKNA